MTKTQRKRLEKLAEYHETKVKRRDFHMSDFGHCAAHHACSLFKKVGFEESHGLPSYQGLRDFGALKVFFGVEAYYASLFSFDFPVKTPKQWAKSCRAFLASI